jgi:nicotinamidase-related amidase
MLTSLECAFAARFNDSAVGFVDGPLRTTSWVNAAQDPSRSQPQEQGEQHHPHPYGTWGGQFRGEFEPLPGEIVAQEHWCSSGFANTDLDLQLKKHGSALMSANDPKPVTRKAW